MVIHTLPARDTVLNLLRYDPDTGQLFWRTRASAMFPDIRSARNWNAKYAGKVAGYCAPNRTVRISVFKTMYLAHRLAWLIHYGEPVPAIIDHQDMNPSNNAISNLRAATKAQNMHNRNATRSSKTGIKGVSVHRGTQYRAEIWCCGTRRLRYFSTIEEAAEWRRETAKLLHGEFARD